MISALEATRLENAELIQKRQGGREIQGGQGGNQLPSLGGEKDAEMTGKTLAENGQTIS